MSLFDKIDPIKTMKFIKKDNPIHYCPICKEILLMGVKVCSKCREERKEGENR